MSRLSFLVICLHKQLKRRMNNQTDPNAQRVFFFSSFYGAQLNNSMVVGVAGESVACQKKKKERIVLKEKKMHIYRSV